MQAALGRLYDTVGIDIDPADLVKLDAAVLGRKTEEIMASWAARRNRRLARQHRPRPPRSRLPPTKSRAFSTGCSARRRTSKGRAVGKASLCILLAVLALQVPAVAQQASASTTPLPSPR